MIVSNVSIGSSKKGLAHVQLQMHLQAIIPDLELEKPFPSIGRIGDAVWKSEKIVFEIQCSAMSAQEAEARMADYGREGFHVVWILSDEQFNQRVLSSFEALVRPFPCYYFRGVSIYDQLEVIRNGRRIFWGRKFFVDVSKPRSGTPFVKYRHHFNPRGNPFWGRLNYCLFLTKDISRRTFAFQGDLGDRLEEVKAFQQVKLKVLARSYFRSVRWLYCRCVRKILEITL